MLYNPVRGVPNFHFMKCSDILDKEQTGWIKTYRFTHNLSGSFYVYNKYKALFERQFIRPCEKCLSEWNNGQGYKNYSNVNEEEKNKIISSFNIIDFFDSCDENRPELIELYKLMENNKVWLGSDIDNKYPENWKFISRMYRIANRYRCESCGVDLTAYAHSTTHGDLLVVHHINGSHPDVASKNMIVLCKECHSYIHRYVLKNKNIELTNEELTLLQNLREQQDIFPSSFLF